MLCGVKRAIEGVFVTLLLPFYHPDNFSRNNYVNLSMFDVIVGIEPKRKNFG